MKLDKTNPLNQGVLQHFRWRRWLRISRPITSPKDHRDPYMGAGCHPDVVERMWNALGSSLPADCRAMVYGTPALVHDTKGIVLALGYGTAYAIRVPDEAIEDAVEKGCSTEHEWNSGRTTNIEEELGRGWVFGAFAKEEEQWLVKVYSTVGGASQQVLPADGLRLQQKNDTDPYVKLESTIDLLPEFYRTEPGFSDCIRLLANRDPRAVESLLALTKVEGHYFSDEFWKELAECATYLNLPVQVSYCSQQIERNAKELDWRTSKGWSTVKSGPSSYTHHIAQSIKDGWNEERRRKHNVPTLLRENGFHLARDGRTGTIYYVRDGQLIEIDMEASGSRQYDIIIFFESVTHYVLPEKVSLSEGDKNQLKTELVEWLRKEGIRAHLG